ncbi:MAG: 5-methylcytosine-specific restriction endonuclease McrA [Motiliproteus sp.]|jgi:5-methylcytosine-specific restriction endonuclease McrA
MSAKKKLARQKFRDDVLKRDHNHCVICKTQDTIDAHHITDRELMPGGGYVKENGITLCHEHIEMAEHQRQSDGVEGEELYAPGKLYIKIGSNYEKALKASERLEGH